MWINKREEYLGKVYKTNEGCKVTIVEYIDAQDVTAEFEDGCRVINTIGNIKNGSVRNPNRRVFSGFGYSGKGSYRTWGRGNNNKLIYNQWRKLINKVNNPHTPNITICKEWECFQSFAEWAHSKYKPHMSNWSILCLSNEDYISPETCFYIPKEINLTFHSGKHKNNDLPKGVNYSHKKYVANITERGKYRYIGTFSTQEEAFNAYKNAKEDQIKKLADKYRDILDLRTYETLYNYEVRP